MVTETFPTETITATPEQMMAAREWIMDCIWADVEPEDVPSLPDRQVIIGIRSFYDGGWSQFVADTTV